MRPDTSVVGRLKTALELSADAADDKEHWRLPRLEVSIVPQENIRRMDPIGFQLVTLLALDIADDSGGDCALTGGVIAIFLVQFSFTRFALIRLAFFPPI